MCVSLINRLSIALLLVLWLGCNRPIEPAADEADGKGQQTDSAGASDESSAPEDDSKPTDEGSGESKTDETKTPDATDPGPQLLDPNRAGDDKAAGDQPAASQPPENPIDLAYISSDMTAAMIVRPRHSLSSEFVKKLNLGDDFQESGGFPFDPETIQRMVVMAAPPADGSPEPRVGGVFQFSDSDPVAAIRQTYPFPDVEEVHFEGQTYFRRQPFDLEEESKHDLPAEDSAGGEDRPDDGLDGGIDSEPLIRPAAEDGAVPCGPENDSAVDTIPEGALDGAPAEAFGGGLEIPPEEGFDGKDFGAPPLVDDPEAFYFPDDTTAVIAPESLLKVMLTAQDVDTPLTRKLRAIDADHDVIAVVVLGPFADMIEELENAPIPIPAPVKIVLAMSNQLKSIELTADLAAARLVRLEVEAANAEAAEQIALLASGLVEGLKRNFGENRQQMLGELPADVGPSLLEMGERLLDTAQVQAAGDRVTLVLPKPDNWGQLPELLQPFIAAARAQAERTVKANNIRQIGLAMHVYAETHDGFPAISSPSREGGHPVSWRVKMLPYLEQTELYEKYRQDEPWDSEHNLTLLNQMPAVYGDDEEGKTVYRVFTGDDTFLKVGERQEYSGVRDGFSNSIMMVQAGEDKATPWTKPAGLPYDPEQPHAALGKIGDAGIIACFGDVSVRVLPRDIKATTLKALITANGGEQIDISELDP